MNLEIRFRLPNQEPKTIPVQNRIMIGTLLSNDIVLRTPGVEPIHAMVESLEDGQHVLTDLGSQTGVKLNGRTIDVEQSINIGDVITIGDVKMDVLTYGASADENFQSATTRTPVAGEAVAPKTIRLDDDLDDLASPAQHTMAGAAGQDDEATSDTSATPDYRGPHLDEPTQHSQAANVMAGDTGSTGAEDDGYGYATDDEDPDEDPSRFNQPAQISLETGYIERKAVADPGGTMDQSSHERKQDVKETVRQDHRDDSESGRAKKPMLFSPRKAKPSGEVLEVVSYWGDTVLDVELFHPTFKGYEVATIGSPPKSHFLAGGKENISQFALAQTTASGYKLRLLPDMHARLRKGGKVGEKKGKGSVSMGKRDIAHIAHGPVKYFLSFVKPPALSLPRKRAKDPMFAMLMAAAFVFYFAAIPAIYMSSDASEEVDEDDIWSIVNLPEKKEPPKPEVPKPKQKVAEVKTKPPTLKPPKPKPKPPKPVKPKEKPKPPKKVEKPKQKKPVTKPTKSLANARKKVPKPKPSRSRSKGMVSTGAKKPDFKAPGKDRGGPKGLAGGPRGGGKVRRNAGGARKGKSKADVRGVEGGAAGKASGVNLKKLGLGAGKILGKAGAGAVKTDFRNSAGGAGGGSGSASKTYGLGGPGKGRSLGVSGTGGAANNFGGYGGDGSGANGLGGAGIGKGFGRKGGGQGRAEVVVPPGDPVISGGLTMQEVHAVIRANLNQIRHCYNQLLQRSPNSSGKIKVNFKVNASGRVAGVSIMQSSINDSIMKSCVTGKIRRWKFPKPRGGQSVTVNYPFVFNPL